MPLIFSDSFPGENGKSSTCSATPTKAQLSMYKTKSLASLDSFLVENTKSSTCSTAPTKAPLSSLKARTFGSEELISSICHFVEIAIRDHHARFILETSSSGPEFHRSLTAEIDLQSPSGFERPPRILGGHGASSAVSLEVPCLDRKITSASSSEVPYPESKVMSLDRSESSQAASHPSHGSPQVSLNPHRKKTVVDTAYSFLTTFGQHEHSKLERDKAKSLAPRQARRNETLYYDANDTGCLKKLVTSTKYEVGLALLIVSQAAFMGMQTVDMHASRSIDPSLRYRVVDSTYLAVFVLEIVIRMLAYGCSFFTVSRERHWNVFDLFLVGISAGQWCLNYASGKHSPQMKILEVLRSLRAIRILRAIASFPVLRPLRLLISSIVQTLGSCFWALLLLFCIVYIFGLCFTHGAIQHLYQCETNVLVVCADREPDIYRFFGGLNKSILTLFQSICGGVNWGEPMDALSSMGSVGQVYVAVFMLYVGFTYFAVLNVVTALFCQHAVESSLSDQDVLLEKKQAGLNAMRHRLHSLFRVLDELGKNTRKDAPNDMFTLADLELCMDDEKVCGDLALLGIEADDAWTLFKLLDIDGVGAIDLDRFVSGCFKLHGHATKMDVQLLLYENKFLFDKLDGFMSYVVKKLDALGGPECKGRPPAFQFSSAFTSPRLMLSNFSRPPAITREISAQYAQAGDLSAMEETVLIDL